MEKPCYKPINKRKVQMPYKTHALPLEEVFNKIFSASINNEHTVHPNWDTIRWEL
jgi:hypothetical protein